MSKQQISIYGLPKTSKEIQDLLIEIGKVVLADLESRSKTAPDLKTILENYVSLA